MSSHYLINQWKVNERWKNFQQTRILRRALSCPHEGLHSTGSSSPLSWSTAWDDAWNVGGIWKLPANPARFHSEFLTRYAARIEAPVSTDAPFSSVPPNCGWARSGWWTVDASTLQPHFLLFSWLSHFALPNLCDVKDNWVYAKDLPWN